MNVLEHIECESSAESDLSVVEDDFNYASEDDDYRELSHESDIMANFSSSSTSRSTCLESASNSSSSTSRSSAVSLLSVLKAPTVSDLSRKNRQKSRTSWEEKSKLESTNSQSNPRTIKPQQRVTEYPKEPFTVASGKL